MYDLVVAAIEAVEVLVFSPLFVPKRQKAQLWTLINIYIILTTWIFYTNAIDHSSVIIIEYGWGITMEIDLVYYIVITAAITRKPLQSPLSTLK